jgi:hypothetical protein
MPPPPDPAQQDQASFEQQLMKLRQLLGMR